MDYVVLCWGTHGVRKTKDDHLERRSCVQLPAKAPQSSDMAPCIETGNNGS